MRVAAATFLLATIVSNVAQAQMTYITPGYSTPYRGNGFNSPYPTVTPGIVTVSPFTGGGAGGVYPPGARTCVAAENICTASAPNTVGNPCSCPDRDGRPTPGVVR